MFSHNLATGLAKRGHQVMVICPSRTGRNYTQDEDGVKVAYLRSVSVKVYPDQVHSVPSKKRLLGKELPHLWYRHGLRASVFPQLEVKKLLDNFQPDVVHVQVSDPIGLSVVSYARRNHIPVVTTEHNQPEVLTDSLKMPGAVKKPVNGLLSAYFRNRQSKSDFVTMPTEQAIHNLLKKKDLGVPIAAVSNGVDLSHFKPGKVAQAFYHRYHLPTDRPVVLYVGRIDPEKRLELAIQAFRQTLAKVPDALMVIVGDGVDKARLQKLVQKQRLEDSVKFMGKILPPDLYDFYRLGTVFITASEIETQGIVLVEAAAAGLPLIAVDKGAVNEICLDGKNGFLCQSRDVSELSQALTKILTDPTLQTKFSQASIKIAHEHDFTRTLDKFINIYQHVSKPS